MLPELVLPGLVEAEQQALRVAREGGEFAQLQRGVQLVKTVEPPPDLEESMDVGLAVMAEHYH